MSNEELARLRSSTEATEGQLESLDCGQRRANRCYHARRVRTGGAGMNAGKPCEREALESPHMKLTRVANEAHVGSSDYRRQFDRFVALAERQT